MYVCVFWKPSPIGLSAACSEASGWWLQRRSPAARQDFEGRGALPLPAPRTPWETASRRRRSGWLGAVQPIELLKLARGFSCPLWEESCLPVRDFYVCKSSWGNHLSGIALDWFGGAFLWPWGQPQPLQLPYKSTSGVHCRNNSHVQDYAHCLVSLQF